MSRSIPAVLCGKTPAIAAAVKANLLPECEVIHAIFSPEAGVTQIPFVLRGEAPSPKDVENVGTQNYSRPAATVILGGAYDDAMVSQMREACKESSRVPWLRLNQSTPTPPLGPEYGKALVERIKVGLKELEAKGNMKEDGVYYY